MAKAKVEKYQELIAELSGFQAAVGEASDLMTSAAAVCLNNMEEDDVSKRACGKVKASAQKYADAIEKAQKLQQSLQAELEKIIEYERESEQDE